LGLWSVAGGYKAAGLLVGQVVCASSTFFNFVFFSLSTPENRPQVADDREKKSFLYFFPSTHEVLCPASARSQPEDTAEKERRKTSFKSCETTASNRQSVLISPAGIKSPSSTSTESPSTFLFVIYSQTRLRKKF
jgi:hypothetical protein